MASVRKQIYAKTRREWREWLKKNHKQTEAVWLIQHKKNSTQPCVTYDEAVEEALCFGWIDSVVNKLDDTRYLMMMSPRRPKSAWSKSNKDRAARLIKQRKITKAGMVKIDAAKKDGSWEALDSVDAGTIPTDLKKALNANKVAKKNFESFSPSHQREYLAWINSAKKPETRANRIAKTVTMVAAKERL